ncbi:MAG TPA: HEAT repeat domain-containing protein, partial [Gemmatimonadales bacterium]|nr:HEAT repeat domain-containing protein [Gemmatimonadales bacterium]
ASFTLLPLVVAALVAASACSQGGSAAGPVAAPHARQAPLDSLLVQIRSGPPELRRRAAGQLSRPGPRIEERMRALRGALGDPDRQVSTAAGWSLGEIGAPAIPVLSDALRDPDPAVRRRAAAAMGKVGLAARDAVKEAMTDPDKSVRNMAALVIAGMGPRASRGAGAADLGSDRDLAQGLKSSDPAVRLSVLLRYQSYVGDTDRSLPLLISALGDADPFVRRAAANTLVTLGPSARDALSAALSDSNPTIRREAAIALVRLSRGTP